MFKTIRITILLVILALVGANTVLTQLRSTNWNSPLFVAIHPINGDGSDKTERYINRLKGDDFAPLEAFFAEQAIAYGVLASIPVLVNLGDRLESRPPALPESSNVLSVMIWSLKFRYWSWQMKKGSQYPGADVHLYVLYNDPDQVPELQHSVGLQKGMAGIVNAYGDRRYAGSNKVVMAHELLHTLGATDKYDPASGLPFYPQGYAEPERLPLYPQRYAEIMGGHIALTEASSQMPKGLSQVVIGRQTADEINW